MLRTIDAATVMSWIRDGHAVLIDVREADEHARERVPGAFPLPLTQLDGTKVPRDQRVAVFHCASGNRTREAAARLVELGFTEAYQLDGGLAAWKKAGFATRLDRSAPISLERQVQITAGSMVMLGVLLAWLISPWFVLLSAVVGGGLVFTGITGSCGLAQTLMLLPFNRPHRRASGRGLDSVPKNC